ncbi:hypothetical protein ACYOEI_09000 [Singulisphaera rosea]
MRRWHEEYPQTLREWKKHYLSHVEVNVRSGREIGKDPYEVDCVCDLQRGRFRKGRAFSCKTPRCLICHGEKYPRREPTKQERFADQKLREELAGS